MSLALLFPGQGSQQPNMLHTLPDSPAVTATLAEAPADIDSADALSSTVNAQLALLVAGVACARALTVDYGLMPRFVAGHSVGAFAAAVTAGVLTLQEALAAVELRGHAMEAACAGGDWGMAAVTGLPTRDVQRLVDQVVTDEDPVWLANINGATQTVVSGTSAALQRISDVSACAGAIDCTRLDVAVASHCPLQEFTVARLVEHLAQLPRRDPTARYLTNVGGRAVNTADAILDDLARAVANPVRWYDAMRLLPELGATCAVETRPGHVLTPLVRSAAPGVIAVALQDSGLATAAARARADG
jgi:malonate decarboxylase epsilon subunit